MDKQVFLETSKEAVHILNSFREELDDHRISINENTIEIQTNFAFIEDINKKLDVLNSRVNQLFDFLKIKPAKKEYDIAPLTAREKEVFQAVYSLLQGHKSVKYRQIALKLGVREGLVSNYIATLIEKGVPVLKHYSGGVVHLSLEKEFAQLQAKKNILGINTLLTYWM